MAVLGAALSAWELAEELVALFGCLCLVFNVLLPAATIVAQLVLYDGPEQLAQWQRHSAQQDELAQLQAKIERLERRRARQQQVNGEADTRSKDIEATGTGTGTARRKPPRKAAEHASVPVNKSASAEAAALRRRRRRHSTDSKPTAAPGVVEQKDPRHPRRQDERTEALALQVDPPPHRHRLSIYSTAKKKAPRRLQDAAASHIK